MHRPRPLLPLATLLTAAACSSGGADPVTDAGLEILPFEEIQDSDITFEADPLDTSRAIFRVTTTIPTICAIVWGETDEFGRFNNSHAMFGTGIEQHDVVLPDLEQGVEYQYVLQGSGPDGAFRCAGR